MPAVNFDPNNQMDGGGSFLSPPPPFLSKTYDMVDDVATDGVISWGSQNNSFVVWDQSELSKVLLPKYFKHSNFSSFVRQLNTYGFKKVDPDKWEFANEAFLRGQKHLLKNINRRRSSHTQSQPQQPQTQNNTSVASCVELGNFGINGEIERLKRDKNILMQELVKLRQQQQDSNNQLQTMCKRLQGMEHHQKLMMSFLAKAMQRPDLFAQLRQQNETNRQISGLNKRRRLQTLQTQEGNTTISSPDGQIIKYEPLLNMLESINNEVTLAQALKNDGILPPNPVIPDFPTEIPVAIPCEFPEMQGMMLDGSVGTDLPIEDFVTSDVENLPMENFVENLPMENFVENLPMENFVASEVESTYVKQMDGSENDLDIVGSLFEELLTATELGSNLQLPISGSAWESARNMDNLTVQIGLLASESKGMGG